MCGELAWECRMRYREVVTFDHHGTEKRVTIEFGVVPVRLSDIPDRLLHMVVVRGFGQKPMMLLTTLAKTTTREALWQVVEGYITRWRIAFVYRLRRPLNLSYLSHFSHLSTTSPYPSYHCNNLLPLFIHSTTTTTRCNIPFRVFCVFRGRFIFAPLNTRNTRKFTLPEQIFLPSSPSLRYSVLPRSGPFPFYNSYIDHHTRSDAWMNSSAFSYSTFVACLALQIDSFKLRHFPAPFRELSSIPSKRGATAPREALLHYSKDATRNRKPDCRSKSRRTRRDRTAMQKLPQSSSWGNTSESSS